jgi:RNA polymerase sigma-70 factor (ECF subfamily)
MEGAATNPDLFLARRAAAGHGEAWDQLVDRYGRRLYNLAFQFSRSPEEAEDLTQEIFVRLYLNLRTYRGDVPLAGWALSLSRNLCIDHYRRTRRERSWQRVAEAVLEQLPACGGLQEDLENRQRVQEVYSALAELAEEFAEVLLLCDLQGFTLEEASTFLEVPLGTVKSRLHRARERLTAIVRARLEPRSPGRSNSEVDQGC